MLKLIDRFIARIRVYGMTPDGHCAGCGELWDRMIVHNTGDGWLWAWECPNYCGWGDETSMIYEWPWIRKSVWGSDWGAIGIEEV